MSSLEETAAALAAAHTAGGERVALGYSETQRGNTALASNNKEHGSAGDAESELFPFRDFTMRLKPSLVPFRSKDLLHVGIEEIVRLESIEEVLPLEALQEREEGIERHSQRLRDPGAFKEDLVSETALRSTEVDQLLDPQLQSSSCGFFTRDFLSQIETIAHKAIPNSNLRAHIARHSPPWTHVAWNEPDIDPRDVPDVQMARDLGAHNR